MKIQKTQNGTRYTEPGYGLATTNCYTIGDGTGSYDPKAAPNTGQYTWYKSANRIRLIFIFTWGEVESTSYTTERTQAPEAYRNVRKSTGPQHPPVNGRSCGDRPSVLSDRTIQVARWGFQG